MKDIKVKAKIEYDTVIPRIKSGDWSALVIEHAINVVLLVCILIIVTAAIGSIAFNKYIGGVSGTVKAYKMSDDGEIEYVTDLPRGIKIESTGATAEIQVGNDKKSSYTVKLSGVKIPDDALSDSDAEEALKEKEQATSSDNDQIYIPINNIANRKSDIVQEKELFVRTPATVYENEDGPEIAGHVGKGEQLEILSKGNLQDSGFIDQYKIAYTDEKGERQEGYVYGKYMVGTEAEALENYNLHGEYDTARKAEYGFDLGGGHAKKLDYYPVEKPAFDDNELCTSARTMYINTYAAVHPDAYVDLIKDTDCNAVVIDIKDGQLTYKSEVAKEIAPYAYKEAYASEEDFKAGVDAYKDAGVYTIGRIVVFNDSRYAKDHPEDCIVYGGSKNWPSAYSRNVWEYNVKLAIEAVDKFGFDEIQFDYVRFPETSYQMFLEGANFRNTYKEEKAQAIQGFCYYACDEIHKHGAYVSIDVFGECSYNYVTAYGQYWPAISNIVDAVSSMPYSDHHGENDTWTHPYGTLHAWAKRTADRQREIPTPAIDRTWITGYDTPYWNPTVTYDTKIMKQQIKALTDAGLNGGFIPWNVLSDIEKYRSYKEIWNKSAE